MGKSATLEVLRSRSVRKNFKIFEANSYGFPKLHFFSNFNAVPMWPFHFYFLVCDMEFILFSRWKYTGAFPLQRHLSDHWDSCHPSRGHHGGKFGPQLGSVRFARNFCPKPATKRPPYLKWVKADLKPLEIWNLCWPIKLRIVFILMFIVQDPSQLIQVRNSGGI